MVHAARTALSVAGSGAVVATGEEQCGDAPRSPRAFSVSVYGTRCAMGTRNVRLSVRYICPSEGN
jgi:hypothetical protein